MVKQFEPKPRLPLCSDASLAAGEDPVGTAPHWKEVTVLELDVAIWDRLRRSEDWTAEQQGVFTALRNKVETSGAGFGLLMSDPRAGNLKHDNLKRDNLEPDNLEHGRLLRVRHYLQSKGLQNTGVQGGGFVRRDYQSQWPQSEWARGLHDTLLEPSRLYTSGDWQEMPVAAGLDFHVCTHGTVDAACGRYGVPVVQALQAGGTRTWRTGHFGGHRFAATAVELPSGLLWAHLTPELALQVSRREVHPVQVRQHLRGFAGLPPRAQMLDRELLTKHGWDWLSAERSARIEGDTVHLSYDWNGQHGEASANVTEVAPLMLPGSSHAPALAAVRQYALSNLKTDLRLTDLRLEAPP